MCSLRGRSREISVLEDLAEAVQSSKGRVLVVRGEAGIGKSALIKQLVQTVPELHLLRAVGVESEMELRFGGLHQLCAPLLDLVPRLPGPQRDALNTVFGLQEGRPPDPLLLGLALLNLVSEAAERTPLLCVVDDGHWLDRASAQALAFVGRRLLADPVGVVIATRVVDPAFADWPELDVGGLTAADAMALLCSLPGAPLDSQVRDRIVADAHGNPLALLDWRRALTPADPSGGLELPGGGALSGRLEENFRRRLARLPAETQQLLLVAAAEPLGDASRIWSAAERLGVGAGAAVPAEEAALVEFRAAVRFAHPLVRSAAYHSASVAERQQAHGALAEVMGPDVEADRRAWHLALASPGPDEEVAAELESSASRAQGRGGLSAAAAFLERAAELSLDPRARARRALSAAEETRQAGASEAALRLLNGVEQGSLNDFEHARVDVLRGRVAFGSSHGRDAPPLLLDAARKLQRHDPSLARDTYLEALVAGLFVGRLGDDVGLVQVAEAARNAPGSTERPSDLLLDGFSAVITGGYTDGAPLLRRAVAAFRDQDMLMTDAVRWLWAATHAAHDLWDDESWELLGNRHIELARQVGALSVLPLALSAQIGFRLFSGELDGASSLVQEVLDITAATGNRLPPYGRLALAASRGDEAEAVELIRTITPELAPRGEGMGLTLVEHAKATLYNGLGRYRDACDAARRGADHPHELAFSTWSLVQLVEAAARSDQMELAIDAVYRLAETTQPSGTHWALGIEARCRALVSVGPAAEDSYGEAIDHLGRTRLRYELARAHLLYGEWLRRQNRRVDARRQLWTAHEMLSAMGANGFAERARRELLATGEKVRKRSVETAMQLTDQEACIAHLVTEGLTNIEIGGQLFVSSRTVEYHLSKVFSKLGVGSRRELRSRLQTVGA
jgi:DNA-binding CsgD family transcriptional regulator